MFRFVTLVVGLLLALAEARKWNDTGRGTIVFEEAVSFPDIVPLAILPGAQPLGVTFDEFLANLQDVHDQRLARMDKNGVDFMVLSLVTPGIQGISDQALAESSATAVNNALAATISNNTMRFGGFAALSLHNATQAAEELRRTVTEFGFLGALINDFQVSGPDNETLLYLDTTDYDPFWEVVQELDVPIYLHPSPPTATLRALSYEHAPWIIGPSHQYAVQLSNHVIGIAANGVLDRFPKVKIIVGHLGERLPSDFWRINNLIARQVPLGMPMLRNFSDYWGTNFFETTSGDFATDLLHFHISQIGLDRITYSVDYPFIELSAGQEWLETLDLPAKQKLALIRGTAIEMLGLNK